MGAYVFNRYGPYIYLAWKTNDPNQPQAGYGYDIMRSQDGGASYQRLAFGYPKGHLWYVSGFEGFLIQSGWTYYFHVQVSDDNCCNFCQGPPSNVAVLTIP